MLTDPVLNTALSEIVATRSELSFKFEKKSKNENNSVNCHLSLLDLYYLNRPLKHLNGHSSSLLKAGLLNTLSKHLESLAAALIDGLTTMKPSALSNHQQSSLVDLES